MFRHIGKKIKLLANITFWFQVGIYLILSFIFFNDSDNGVSILLGCAFLIVGPAVAWLTCFLLYGFGELIDKACQIEKNTRITMAVNYPQETQYSNRQASSLVNNGTDIDNLVRAESINQKKVEKLISLREKNLLSDEEYHTAIENIANEVE